MEFAPLVPELIVTDLAASLDFWCGKLGFEIAYDRPEERFAYLVRGGAQVMMFERRGQWETAELERPLGRGINLQILVDRIDPVLDALYAAEWTLFEPPVDAWFRVGGQERGQREFLVQDPDGYLVRFAQVLCR